jgi:polar amino acid transport system substrate-binding protein
LAPDGTLRVAINYGNPVLAQRAPAAGAPHGVSAALARALAQKLNVPVAFEFYNEAGQVSGALHANQAAWDVAFLAVDPVRAADIVFTAPYVEIEGAYLVHADSPLHAVGDVDRTGVRIAVAKGSAYDLFLTRTLKHAQLLRFPLTEAATKAFLDRHVEVLAGVREPLVAYAASRPSLRLLPGRFMVIEQAMAIPKDRAAALPFLRDFVEQMKASGFVARALAESGQTSATVAPPAG